MSSHKAQGKHSREERLRKLAEEEGTASAGGGFVSGEAAEDATLANTAVMPQAGNAVAEDSLAGFDIDASGFPLDAEPAETGAFVAKDFSEIPKKRKRRALKALGITAGVAIACLLVAYVAGAAVFMGRFLPNTSIGGNDVSLMTDDEVAALLDGQVAAYRLNVEGDDFAYEVNGADVGLAVDSRGIVEAMHSDLDAWRWPLLIVEESHDETPLFTVTFDREASDAGVAAAVKAFNKQAKAPVDASIVFNDTVNQFEVKPEEEGTQLKAKAVKAAVAEAVEGMQPALVLGEDHLKKPKVYSTDEKLIESAKLATGMVSAHVALLLDGQNVELIDGGELSQFVKIDDKLDVKLKEDDMKTWVNDLTSRFDTIGSERHYTRADGEKVTVKGGSYGWEIDSAATNEAIIEAIKNGETTEVEIPCIHTAATYSGSGERDWGNRYLDVDISEQHVRFYGDNGKIIWETDFISGAPDGKRNTWEGVWYINNKESPSTLIGYTESGKKEYETKVKYWMPFEGNGIGFHDAPWQPGFGGTMYQDGYGSHGCVNLSSDDAKELYKIIEIGDVVVVHE